MTLGERIRTARQRARLTQEQLARKVGVGRRTIDNWENGRTEPKNLVALEEVLGALIAEHVAGLEAEKGEAKEAAQEAGADAQEGHGYELTLPARFRTEERQSKVAGWVVRIITDLDADTEGIPDEEADAMIERAMANAEAQARLMLDAERRRWERRREQGDADAESQT